MTTQVQTAGGYRYIPAVSQYSAGVAAETGFRIERARFSRVVALREGFERIEQHLKAMGRPHTALCACELRSPEPFTESSFKTFNETYTGTLKRWGIFSDGEANPIARSNVCPELDAPSEPGIFAFSYTVADDNASGSFIVAGSAEAPEGTGDYAKHAIAHGDTSAQGLRSKARWVLDEMQNRMNALGFDWPAATATHVYTVHDFHPLVGDELVRRQAMRGGLTWHFARPPVVGLDYEMDCRAVPLERVIEV